MALFCLSVTALFDPFSLWLVKNWVCPSKRKKESENIFICLLSLRWSSQPEKLISSQFYLRLFEFKVSQCFSNNPTKAYSKCIEFVTVLWATSWIRACSEFVINHRLTFSSGRESKQARQPIHAWFCDLTQILAILLLVLARQLHHASIPLYMLKQLTKHETFLSARTTYSNHSYSFKASNSRKDQRCVPSNQFPLLVE